MNFPQFKRVGSLVLAGVALIVFQVAAVQKAFAHHPNVTATAVCGDKGPVINYTASSWDPGNPNGEGDNPEIDILFNGATLATGAFLPSPAQVPPDQFSGTVNAPQGASTVDVQAVAVGVWGDQYPPGDVSGVVTVTIPTNCSTGIGRFTGGGKQVTVGNVVVTKGFEVDCDLHQPSNNLEINWSNPGESGSHHFHMTAFLEAACTLVKKPNPPTAPVNTIIAKGTGRFDNTDGYTVLFELVDNGEPGTSDAAMFMVFETANPSNVVLNCPLEIIATGNIQAHVDQH